MKMVQLTMTEAEFIQLSAAIALHYHLIVSGKFSHLVKHHVIDDISVSLLDVVLSYPQSTFENLINKIQRLTDEIDRS